MGIHTDDPRAQYGLISATSGMPINTNDLVSMESEGGVIAFTEQSLADNHDATLPVDGADNTFTISDIAATRTTAGATEYCGATANNGMHGILMRSTAGSYPLYVVILSSDCSQVMSVVEVRSSATNTQDGQIFAMGNNFVWGQYGSATSYYMGVVSTDGTIVTAAQDVISTASLTTESAFSTNNRYYVNKISDTLFGLLYPTTSTEAALAVFDEDCTLQNTADTVVMTPGGVFYNAAFNVISSGDVVCCAIYSTSMYWGIVSDADYETSVDTGNVFDASMGYPSYGGTHQQIIPFSNGYFGLIHRKGSYFGISTFANDGTVSVASQAMGTIGASLTAFAPAFGLQVDGESAIVIDQGGGTTEYAVVTYLGTQANGTFSLTSAATIANNAFSSLKVKYISADRIAISRTVYNNTNYSVRHFLVDANTYVQIGSTITHYNTTPNPYSVYSIITDEGVVNSFYTPSGTLYASRSFMYASSVIGVATETVAKNASISVATRGSYTINQNLGSFSFNNTANTPAGSKGNVIGITANLYGTEP